jgi:hypothetical protein
LRPLSLRAHSTRHPLRASGLLASRVARRLASRSLLAHPTHSLRGPPGCLILRDVGRLAPRSLSAHLLRGPPGHLHYESVGALRIPRTPYAGLRVPLPHETSGALRRAPHLRTSLRRPPGPLSYESLGFLRHALCPRIPRTPYAGLWVPLPHETSDALHHTLNSRILLCGPPGPTLTPRRIVAATCIAHLAFGVTLWCTHRRLASFEDRRLGALCTSSSFFLSLLFSLFSTCA